MGLFKTDPKQEAKDNKKKKMEAAAKAYGVIRGENTKAYTGMGEKNTKSRTFLQEYADVIDAYIQEFTDEKPSNENVDRLIKDYYRLFPTRKPLPPIPTDAQFGKETVRNGGEKVEPVANEKKKARPQFLGNVGEDVSKLLGDTTLKQADIGEQDRITASKGISASAMAGLRDISQWLLRNSAKTGGFGDTKTSFVTQYILKQPARVKLLAYYLVESDKRKATGEDALKEAVMESQLNYVPNLQAFKDKMIASKFKFWKRVNAEHFYWDKLSQSMRFAASNVDAVLPFGSMDVQEATGPVTAEKVKAKPPVGQQSQTAQSSQVSQQSSEPEELTLLGETREEKMRYFLSMGQSLADIKKQYAANTKKEAGEALAQKLKDASKTFILAYQDLEASDKAVCDSYKKFVESGRLQGGVSLNDTSASTVKDISTYTGYGALALGSGGLVASSQAVSAIKEINDGEATTAPWYLFKMSKSGLEKLQTAGDIIAIVGAASNFVSYITGVIDLAENSGHLSAGEKTIRTLDLISKALSIDKTITMAAMSLGHASKEALTAAGGVFGAVTGGVDMVAGTTSIIVAGVQKSRLTAASENISKRDDQTDAEKKMAADTAKLGKRLASTKQINGTLKVISGGLQLTGGILNATAVAAPVGAILNGIGTVVGLSSLIVCYVRKKGNINNTIDEYISMDKMFDLVVSNMNTNKDSQEVLKRADKIKDQLRIEAAAQLGYPSKLSLYTAITFEYAKFLYNHIFYKNGDTSKPIKKLEDCDKDYLKLLNGFGLKPDFSMRRPDVKTIAKSMENV